MKNKKITSIIALSGILAMSGQVITPIVNNKLLINHNREIDNTNQKNINIKRNKSSNLESITRYVSNNKIENNTITINNVWNYNIGTLKFNPETSKIEFINGWQITNPYVAKNTEVFSIRLYKNNGELIKNVQLNGDNYSPGKEISNAFNNLRYSYGDIIEIDYKQSSKISISNFNGQKNYQVTKPISMEITQNGLKELPSNLTVNPVYFEMGSNKIEVSGKTIPNETVNIWIDNKDYTTISNSSGEYNLNIEASKAITESTQITVFVAGEEEQTLNPTLNPNIYKIVKNNIILMGNWYGSIYKTANISFNPENMKLNITGNMVDYFSSGSGKAFEMSLYSKDGSLIKTETFNNSSQTQDLYNDFNNLGFSYGDIIKINCLGAGQVKVSNYNGENSYLVNKSIQMTITQNGLVPCNMQQIKINPFAVLGSGKVTSGTLTGTIGTPNQVVNVIVDGKTFSGKSNDKGDFSINISDANGFLSTTNILVESSGEIAATIKPTANKNLGILKSNILVHGEDGVIAQEVSFNPATMTVIKSAPWGNNFATQLINGKTGNVIASCGTGDFNAYTSKDNLNGAHFQYGDIISVYETKEMYLTNGSLLLLNGKIGIHCVDCFKNFKITPNGLVPVENNNLTTSQLLYTGSKNLSLTGKTLPNTNITIFYGDKSEIIKSNNDGAFSIEIPFSDTQIGKEVRVFVNNDNNENLVVKYDSKLININTNRIEVLNNTNLPIFNISFNPLNNELSAVSYSGGMTYTGAFFESALNIKLINPTNGNIIYSFNGSKLNNISSFISNINGKSYKPGDIIEISYNPSLVKANVYNGKESIGNTTGVKEYFEITNKGLVNLNNKFINIKPLDILSNTKVVSANIEGQAKPNTPVEVSVNGSIFKGMTNNNGDFSIPIIDKDGFTNNTNIVVSSQGYIPTIINPTMESNIGLQNSYINFYNSKGNYGQISSSIGFNPETMKFVVNNYANSFGNGKSHYFNFDLYSSNGKQLLNASISNGSTSAVTEAINNKSFNYDDIICLSYNNTISKPAILNGSQVLGNISGDEEYFEITKSGLVRVNFGQNAYTNSVYWNNNNLVIDSNLANGQSEETLNSNKKLVILNSNNQIVDSVNTSILNNNPSNIQGIISEESLAKLSAGENYTFALDINNKLFPIKVESNTPSNSSYLLEGNSNNVLTISLVEKPVITIKNSKEISNYVNTLNSNINTEIKKNNINNIMTNSQLNYDIIAREFITRIGVSNLEDLYNKNESNKEFVNWLLNNKIAMEEYLEGTNPTGINAKALQIWSDIWNKYTNSKSGFNLKLAIATAISNANPIMAWPSTHYYGYGDTVTVGSPVERYNIFETLNTKGGMLPIFKTLDVKHIEYVVSTPIANSQIMELRNIIIQNHNGYINGSNSGIDNIAYTINYEMHNPHTGQSVDANSDFYGPHPTVADIWYDGGVCFSIAMLGAAACQVFGVPAQAETQDNGIHKVFIYYNNNKQWNIGNNIFGLSKTFGGDISGWSNGIATGPNTANYNWLYEKANTPALRQSNEYLWLASSDISYEDKMNAINEAIKIQPLNLRAWLDKIALMKTNNNLTAQDYINLSNKIINTFKDYPMPMFDTLLQIKNNILNDGTTEEFNNFVDAIAKTLNSVTNSNQKPIAQDMLALMSKEGLVEGITPLEESKISINNYWGNALGTLEFSSGNMKINVVKGWSRISAYVTGEAFSIGLYNKDGKMIKNLILNGGEWPADDIYNAFNNLNFEYGDKIYIDYKTSSKINVSRVYKDGILDNSYDVNQPSVFEITKDGLVYLGDSLKNSVVSTGTVNVSTVYDNGQKVQGNKYNYTEQGNVNTLIQNESIPTLTGYSIDYVTVNGVKTSLDKLPKEYTNGTINIVYHLKELKSQNQESKDTNKSKNSSSIKDAKNTKDNSNVNHHVKDNKSDNKQHNSTVSSIKSSSKDIYWDYSSLVINGNINLDNEMFSKDTPKEIIIKDSKGNIITSSNTVAVNWYSTDKNNYSGYQGIFTKEQLSKLIPNEVYSIYIEVDGKEVPIVNNIKLSNKEYRVSNENGNLTIERNSEKPLNVGTYETGYFTDFGYVLNGNISLDNNIFSKANTRELIVKDASGNIIDKVNCASINWYSENKDNYSGFQGIITNSVLSKLKAGEEYTFEIEVNYKGKVYNLPIENTKNFILNTSMDYNIGVNAEDNIVISKITQVSSIDSVHGVFKDGYWQPYGYVMNLEVNTGKNIPKGTKMELISKNEEGKVLSVTPGVDVNWYSNSKEDYNGFQAIITHEQLINETGTNKLYVRVILNGKVYEAPVSGNVNVAIGNLNYGFKTINNQVYITIK